MTDEGSEAYLKWVEAGSPEPTAAERVGGGECAYPDCDNDADYRVEWERSTTHLVCQPCSAKNRIYAKENGLLHVELTAGGED